tara:strand:+ start:83 stop:289 length:207 start_codon:yes stop_codon:yes gene_type:complete
MAERKKAVYVKMFGTGNFKIGTDLYPFKDGEKVKVIQPEHKTILEAEAKRREVLDLKISAITAANKSR